MICILSDTIDPFFNIASEEFLLKNCKDDVLMLWKSNTSVIVGKNQNALAEINYSYVKENKIPLIRRISGGGTVCHDLGNINFTFIRNKFFDHTTDNKKFVVPVVNFLKEIGVDACLDGRNDIRIDGKKISGNAECVINKRVLHHGTLLYNSNLNVLRKSIHPQKAVYIDKAVKSVRSEVVNISDYLTKIISSDNFMKNLMNYFLNLNSHNKIYSFSIAEKETINNLAKDKYKTWEWNYGKSPKFQFVKQLVINEFDLKVDLKVEKGIITEAILFSNTIEVDFIRKITKSLIACEHNESDIKKNLDGFYYKNINFNDLAESLF